MSGDERVPAEIDVERYSLEIELQPERARIEGRCTVIFVVESAGTALDLDLCGLEVLGVTDLEGRPIAFDYEGDGLRILPDHPMEAGPASNGVVVAFGGLPRKGIYFVGGLEGHAFSHALCEDARWWFPCKDSPDDLATWEFRVTSPIGWTVATGGERVDVRIDESAGTRSELWLQHRPHAPHLLGVVAGELSEVHGQHGSRSLRYLAPSASAECLPANLGGLDEALTGLEEVLDTPFPLDQYTSALVERLPVTGMDNQGLALMELSSGGGHAAELDGERDPLAVRRLARQWFGNRVLISDWSHSWVLEGLSTYVADLLVEAAYGEEAFHEQRLAELESYLLADSRRPTALVRDDYSEPADLYGTVHLTAGGMSRLHFLRSMLGDDVFQVGLRRFLAEGAGRGITTADLRAALEAASGKDLGGFFSRWVYSPGHPELEVAWTWDESRDRILLRVDQVHSLAGDVPSAFTGPMDVEIRVGDRLIPVRIEVSDRRELFALQVPGRPDWVRVDAARAWPGRLTVERSIEEWRLLAREEAYAHGRAEALIAIADTAVSTTPGSEDRAVLVMDLLTGLRDDDAARVRVAAARGLGRLGSEMGALRTAAVDDPDGAVRAAALAGLVPDGPEPELAALARQRYAADTSVEARSAAARLMTVADPEEGAAWISEALDSLASDASPAGGDQALAAGLVRAIPALPRSQALALLRPILEGTRKVPEPARDEAVRICVELAAGESWLRPALGEMLSSPEPRLRRTGVEALGALGDPESRARLAIYAPDALYPSERRVIEAALER